MSQVTHKEEEKLGVPGGGQSGSVTWNAEDNELRIWVYRYSFGSGDGVGLYMTPDQARTFADNIKAAADWADERREEYLELGYSTTPPPRGWWSWFISWLPFRS